MREPKPHISLYLGLCACLFLSGCFQGYSDNGGSSSQDIENLRLSLTPASQPLASPVFQSTLPVEQVTRVPTLAPPTETNAPIIMEGGIIIHIVKEGDTLFNIAQTYGVTVEALSTMNNINDPNELFIEQALIIPNSTAVPIIPTDEPTLTSNLPTETATPLPTETAMPTFTATATYTEIPSPTATETYTEIPSPISTATYTEIPPQIQTIAYTQMPSATVVTLVTQTPSPTLETQLNADTETIHIVKTGQTLFQISQTYDISLDNLANINNIDDPSQVTIGQALRIPFRPISSTQIEATLAITPSETPLPLATSEPSDVRIHVVSAGETLFQIALDYSVSLDALARANNINDVGQLLTNQELLIPASTPMSVIAISELTSQNPISSTLPERSTLYMPSQINGVPISSFVQISPEAEANILSIYQQGQKIGRDPRRFSKLGDSTIENPHFLARFDHWQGFDYYLGDYAYLEEVIDYFAGSFIREGAAVHRGMHSWTVFDPQWADKTICLPNESSLVCEFRLHNPSILLIRLGANDVGVPQSFENNLRDVVEFTIKNGVIPILGTKADRNDGASNANNLIIRRLAEEYQLPLWDFDRLADTLSRRGLTIDNVHMTINFSHDYTDPNTFTTGHGVHNLSALILLDRLWQILSPNS